MSKLSKLTAGEVLAIAQEIVARSLHSRAHHLNSLTNRPCKGCHQCGWG